MVDLFLRSNRALAIAYINFIAFAQRFDDVFKLKAKVPSIAICCAIDPRTACLDDFTTTASKRLAADTFRAAAMKVLGQWLCQPECRECFDSTQ